MRVGVLSFGTVNSSLDVLQQRKLVSGTLRNLEKFAGTMNFAIFPMFFVAAVWGYDPQRGLARKVGRPA